ncbi:MAG: hypothetical protein ACK4UP_03245 [Spirosomataceae bacterium]
MKYYIFSGGSVKGPFPKKNLLEKGLNKNSYVNTTGIDGSWVIAEDLEDLKDLWEDKSLTEEPINPDSVEIPGEPPKPQVVEDETTKGTNTTQGSSVDAKINPTQPNNYGRFIALFLVAFLVAVLAYVQLKKPTSKTEDSTSSTGIKQEVSGESMPSLEDEKETTLAGITNPQQEYNTLVDEGYANFKSDNLEDALKKLLLADIVRQEYNLTISEQAIEIYEESIKKGDIAFGDGSIKELIPYAILFYKVANAAKNTPEIEARIKESELAL